MIGAMARDLMCHASNLFFEARGESPLGQRWVLDVVRNRVEAREFPHTYCDVVTQPNAFEWYTKWKGILPEDPLRWEAVITKHYRNNPTELRAWRNSFITAFNHYFHLEEDITNGAQYFMTVDHFYKRGKRPFNRTQIASVVGNHIFFKPCEGRSCLSF